MLEICIQTSYDQNVHLILKSYLPVVYGTTLSKNKIHCLFIEMMVSVHVLDKHAIYKWNVLVIDSSWKEQYTDRHFTTLAHIFLTPYKTPFALTPLCFQCESI